MLTIGLSCTELPVSLEVGTICYSTGTAFWKIIDMLLKDIHMNQINGSSCNYRRAWHVGPFNFGKETGLLCTW